VFALIPAGGRSSRMGRPKLLLPLGQRTVLEHVLQALTAAGIERTLVVAAPHLSELATIAKAADVEAALLPEETPDMRATIEFGLRWIEAHWSPAPEDAWLLVPADHPTLEPAVIQHLRATRDKDRTHSVFVPTYQGWRGHPVLISWRHVAAIRDFPSGQGLNQYLRTQSNQTLEVPVTTDSVLSDLDTPEDYERIRQRFRDGGSANRR
jgi:molybdenum cofactor cytidylyltransferase